MGVCKYLDLSTSHLSAMGRLFLANPEKFEKQGEVGFFSPTRRQTAVTRWSRVFAGDALRSSPVSMSGTRSRKKFMRSRLNALQKSHADMRLIL